MRGGNCTIPVGPCRAFATTNTAEKDYQFNSRFTPSEKEFREGIFHGGETGFSRGSDPCKEFMYVFGPSFGHTGVYNACDAHGYNQALRRLTGVRKPGEYQDGVLLHDLLIANQRTVLQYCPLISDYVSLIEARIAYGLSDMHERETLWANTPMPKRALRLSCQRNIDDEGRRLEYLRVHTVKAAFKRGEILPPDKYPRMIVDLGAESSSAAAPLIDPIKSAMAEPTHIGSLDLRFVASPIQSELDEAFQAVLNNPGMVHRFFSDDSILGADCSDGRLLCNVDISAADASYYEPIFELVERLLKADPSGHEQADAVLAQLRHPLTIVNPDKPSERIILRPRSPYGRFTLVDGEPAQTFYLDPGIYLASGSILTTITNNTGNACGTLVASMEYRPSMTKAEVKDLLVRSYARAGMLVTIEECHHVEDLQFLKHSPFYSDGRLGHFLNLGVFFKGFGTYCGELPGTTAQLRDWESRARAFNSDVIKSYVHAGDHCILRALRTKIISDSCVSMDLRGSSSLETPIQSLCARYGVSELDLLDLSDMIVEADVGDRIFHIVIDRVMLVDYGFTPMAEYLP